ncbi:adenylate/guanylate cyclase domain-containing protein [Georgenia sp. EYE_87]|uniref:adenylate/guanylate cyclase domain-containing protein n=1 Tax=Georgenia sp. EYE_87 TaxID=2853448 RepID=UPI002002EF0A|nr:adenylate/guanylate cyclase domain-containing protein [Georgenia sp. EYE_87]
MVRRVVSVVFADLVGFTALSERLDPEDVARIQEEFFASAAATLAEHGGTVEKYIGDAVMATFGVEVASDDDAVRAVRAATGLQHAARRTEAPLGLAPGTLNLRVGVNTGEVVVSRVGDGWRVTGDVVNTAARLQAAAAPGEVLLGPETAFGVGHAFALQPAGEVTLRGKAEPVPVWRPGGTRAVARRGLAALGLHAPMLGRERLLDDLVADLTSSARGAAGEGTHDGGARDGGARDGGARDGGARDGGGRRAALLVAPPGVGKSRVAEELCLRAASAGHPVLVARPDGRASGYGAVAQLMREALAVAGLGAVPDDDALVSWLAGEGFDAGHARTVAGHVRDLMSGALTAEPADLFASWAAALDALPGPAPLWVVEDVHLAGADLRAFLAHVLASPGRGLMLLTARPDASLTDSGPLSGVPLIHLPPLAASDTETMVSALVGADAVPDEYVAGIVRVSGGNPLFVEELLRSWILGGVLTSRSGGWAFGGTLAPSLPTTVHAIYQAQLDRLAPTSREVVERGSVPGTTFPSAALPALGVEEPSLALDSLTRAGLLSGPHAGTVHHPSYTYRHALLRDTAYASLARGRRAELHARFAGWIRGRGPAELVGLHLALALEALPGTAAVLDGRAPREIADEAADWLERGAGEHLVPSPQRAAELLGRALDVAPGAPEPVRLRRALARAEALRRAGRLEEALAAFRDGGSLARVVADPAGLRDAGLGYENALFASRLPREEWGADGLALLDDALVVHPAPGARAPSGNGGADQGPPGDGPAGAVDQVHGRVRLLAARGRALVYAGRRAEGIESGTAAVRLAESTADAAAVAEASLALRAGLAGPEHLTERLDGLTRAVAAAELTGDDELQLEAARLQLVDALEAGDLPVADAAQERAAALAGRMGRPLYLWYPPMWEAMRALLAGSYAVAPGLVATFAEQARRSHYADAAMVRTIQLLELHLMTGGAPEVTAEVAGYAEALPDRWGFAEAVLRTRAGDAGEARRALDHYAAAGFDNVVQDLGRSTSLAYLAEAAAAVGTAPECARLAELLTPWSGHMVVLGSGALCLGPADHFLGLALRGAGDLDRAERHLASAVEDNDALGAAGRAAWSRAELGRTMRLAGRPGSGALLDRARADAAALGMAPLARELEHA